MTDVKICGLKTAEAVNAALSGEARFVGFVFFPPSPRNIAPEAARPLAALARGKADIVAVTVDAGDALLAMIAERVAPDWIQLHGNETPARAAEVRRFAKKGVIKALPIARSEDFAAAAPFEPVADWLMFDAKAPPEADRPGGHGASFDWAMLAGRRFGRPWLLSGGLTPENVPAAVAASGAGALDVSSGVESAPGIKDPARIAAFLAAAKKA
ncbi:MAG TPA: phosphoribosylanthranilate isomerase [Caulobacterales bacterium]|jgi:phosphoribosylanthranilate isomerase|nr:phosphoribosylanthranilate isomerase [Caulobacterales bacterium]